MARHESEMHRQRRELIEALRDIAGTTFDQNAHDKALAAIKAVQPACDQGLFGDHSQMDLQDRKDV